MKKIIVLVALILILSGCQKDIKTIVAFGDSNTQGANWPTNHYDPNKKWVNLLGHYYQNKTIINAGIGGNTSEDGRNRIKKDVLDKKPDLVFIMFGTNDAVMVAKDKPAISHKRFRENMQYIIDKVKKFGAIPVLMTCTPDVDREYLTRHKKEWYANEGGPRKWQNTYDNITRDLAKKNDITLIDIQKYILNKAGGDSDEALLSSGLIDPSGTHLSLKGANFVYQTILKSDVIGKK